MMRSKIMGKTLRHALLCGATLFAVAVGVGGATAAQAADKSFDLPAQSAVTSIPMFARQAGIQIVAPTDQLSGINTGALKGSLDRKVALHQLLKGTPLVVASDDGETVVLRVADKTVQPAETHPAAAPAPISSNDEPATEVVVKGYRSSLQTAQDLKRKAVGTVDVIVSDDIAAFPDLNLAESLQRIPGITITRDAGEGRQIALRGLGADFTRTQLNGMEVLTNTASGMDNRGGVTRSRSFDYSMFASELFDKVTVQKSYSADQDEGGIGGTVQLETAKPFDYKGFEAALSAKAQYNTNVSGEITPRYVGLISDRWGDFGALLSVAYSVNDSNEYGYRDYGWGQIHANAANVGPGVDAATAARLESTSTATELFAPQSDTYSTWYTHRTRFGSTLALQWEPSDTFKVGLDGLFSKLNNQRQDFSLTTSGTNSLTGNLTGTQVVQSAVVQGNTLISASYSGVDLRTEENLDNDSTVFGQLGLHASWHPTDKLSFTGLIGTSKSDYEQPVFDKVFLESTNHTETVNDAPAMPVNTYGGSSLTDPNSWNLMRMDTQESSIISQYDNAKLDAKYVLNDASWLTAGVSYKKFDNTGDTWVNKVFHNTVVNGVSTDTPIPTSMKNIFSFDTLAPYVVGNVNEVYPLIGQTRDLNASFLSPGSNYREVEKTDAFYLQYNLDTDIFGYRVRANAGERYYQTNLESAGSLTSGSSLVPVDVKHTYDGWLPALNIAVDITPSLVARFDANRDVSRPALGDEAATGTITTAPFGGSLSVGNPNLKPFLSDSIESSLEYYQGKVGYVYVGVFWKNMEQWISSSTISEPYSATGYPDSQLVQGETPSTLFTVTTPINVKQGKIQGVELAYQRDFDFLPGVWRHLGFVGNATYAQGSAPALISGVSYNLPLSNLSKYTANATLYYETPIWDVRISEAYRDKYLDGAGSAGNVGDFIAATNNVDFAAHYKLSPKLKLTLEGINLTNQHIIEYANGIGGDGVKRTEVNTSAGTTYTLGLMYSF